MVNFMEVPHPGYFMLNEVYQVGTYEVEHEQGEDEEQPVGDPGKVQQAEPVLGGPVGSFYDQECQANIDDGSCERKEEIGTGMTVAVTSKGQSWDSSLNDPEEDKATYQKGGTIPGRNVFEKRFHTGICLCAGRFYQHCESSTQ